MGREKIRKLADLEAELAKLRAQGKRMVFTNGCFDMLHPGHLRLLEEAKGQGDLLVVAINSDSSVNSLKGPGRPVLNEEARAEILAAVEWVDYVIIFAEATPLKLIETLRPDVLVKGGDYKLDEIVGADVVAKYGGQVLAASLVKDYSSRSLIAKIKSKEKDGSANSPDH